MKLTDELERAFNDQITLEFEASSLYRQLAIEADEVDLTGMASWLRSQADEELVHANKLIDHLADRGNHARIGEIPAPKEVEADAESIFAVALEHEQRVSEAIRQLYRTCEAAGDLDSRPILNWFLEEQLNEVASVDEILGRIRMIGDDGAGLLRLDSELGARPTAATEA